MRPRPPTGRHTRFQHRASTEVDRVEAKVIVTRITAHREAVDIDQVLPEPARHCQEDDRHQRQDPAVAEVEVRVCRPHSVAETQGAERGRVGKCCNSGADCKCAVQRGGCGGAGTRLRIKGTGTHATLTISRITTARLRVMCAVAMLLVFPPLSRKGRVMRRSASQVMLSPEPRGDERLMGTTDPE